MSQFLIASNTSAVFVKTQAAVGSFDNPTYDSDEEENTGVNAIRTVGAPKFAVRGAGIIQRTDTMTPFGGGQAAVTGGLGWDITFQTEFFWDFSQISDITIPRALSQLSALWLASPWNLSVDILPDPPEDPPDPVSSNLVFGVQPFFFADTFRGSDGDEPPIVNPDYTAQPFSIVYEESQGKRFESFDCICIPKISWEFGQRVMIDWTVKGKWRPVIDSLSIVPEYIASGNQPPLIGQSSTLEMDTLLNNANALSKVSFETGWALSDVSDARQTYGFGLGFVALTGYPTVDIEVAEYNTTLQPDWTQAQNNQISAAFQVSIGIGENTIWFNLANPQLIAFPSPTDTNGYRAAGLKFGGIPTADTPIVATMAISYQYPD